MYKVEANSFMEFARCQRADGSHYGTAGQCRKGREVGAKLIEKIIKRLSPTKGGVLQSTLNPNKGPIGEGKDLGNGVIAIRGSAKELEKLRKVPGLMRPVSKVIDRDDGLVIVARKTHRPWEKLEVPKKFLTPYREEAPMAVWINKTMLKNRDVDMAVNPRFLSATSLLKPAYDKYNKEFFDGKLPEVDLFVAPSMTLAAGLAIGNRSNPERPMSLVLSMKRLKNATEEAIHGVLLHEMVHISDYAAGRWNEGHGAIFTSTINRISDKWKRDSRESHINEILKVPGSFVGGGKKDTSGATQFPKIKYSEALLRKATNDGHYRKVQWL